MTIGRVLFSITVFSLGATGGSAFSAARSTTCSTSRATHGNLHLAMEKLSRKEFGAQILAFVPAVALFPGNCRADVSDGTTLPEGAQQFSRALRLKTDIQVGYDLLGGCVGKIAASTDILTHHCRPTESQTARG
jgi:hypothetical protein